MSEDKGLIYLIDDEENVILSVQSGLEKEGYKVHSFLRAEDAFKTLKRDNPIVVITDIMMPELDGIELIQKMKGFSPELNFIVITAHGSLDSAIQALRLGVIDYLVKPFRMAELISTVQKAISQKRFLPVAGESQRIHEKYRLKNLMSRDPQMIEMFHMISKISKTDTTVLILGESGTGKEMMARSIHYNSKRKDKAFVSVNCAALPETLLESELFGYEKGAFTGASSTKQGLFEIAHGGTFFLDEVGEIPLSLQAKLLRVIQERVVVHLGGVREIPVDIRLIAASSRNLPKEVKEGRFREDLFYRLNVVPVVLPPLRERSEDMRMFVDHFLKYYGERHHINRNFRVDEDGINYLKNYQWPGNIRELENLMERIVTLEEKEAITVETLERLMDKKKFSLETAQSNTKNDLSDLTKAVETFEKRMIAEALANAGGNKFKAARTLGLTRQNLRYKLKKYGIQ